jgi:hypothetical protein
LLRADGVTTVGAGNGPLATVVIGGIVSSTLLTLLVLPRCTARRARHAVYRASHPIGFLDRVSCGRANSANTTRQPETERQNE